jgi:hypothetical protein
MRKRVRPNMTSLVMGTLAFNKMSVGLKIACPSEHLALIATA